MVAFVMAITGIFVRLLFLQVKDASALEAMARNQRVRTIPLPASRGTIFDRSGHELAMSLPAKAVFADPKLINHPWIEANLVAGELGLQPRTVHDLMVQTNRFQYLARGVDTTTATRIQKELVQQKLTGVGFQDETRRYYPAGPLAPQVLGFVGIDGAGLEGIERQYNTQLAGRAGQQVVEEDPSGVLIPQGTNVDQPPQPGQDLLLTIDKDIQFHAQMALAAAVKKNHAKGGTVVVLDPHNGDVLAMATAPWFDPNHFSTASPDVRRNRAITDAYEPGSVNKVIMASAAVEDHVLRLNQTQVIPDQIPIYDHVYHDAEIHPTEPMTLGDIIAYSSNVGAIKTAELMGADRFASYLYKFGFGAKTGIAFPGESPGILAPPSKWWGTTLPSVAIGQGIAVTPLQMAAVYATIANGGVWVQPRLVRGSVDGAGKFLAAPTPLTRRVVSERTAQIVTRMLAYGVDVGTGKQAQIPGFWVAGKTGTARKPLVGQLGYSTKYMASFIGFAPASRPALVVACILDEPATVFGGIASAPLFQDITRFALARLRVTPAPQPPIPPHAIPVR